MFSCLIRMLLSNTELFAILLSILSLLISIKVAITEKKYKEIEYNDTYFLSIYKDYMLNKIPQCLVKISFTTSNRLSGEEDFIYLLQEIRRASIYYQFTDKPFYEQLKQTLQQIEDKLTFAHKKEYLVRDQSEFLNQIHDMTDKLYSILNEKRRKF